jgi:alpha-methylacyl-CoA racemase
MDGIKTRSPIPLRDRAARPLDGIRVLDFSALGPGPFASMMLADYGADVLSIRRPGTLGIDPSPGMARGKDIVQIDLSSDEGRTMAVELVRGADVVLESFRPGVMERLGLGPEPLIAANPRLAYARLTGWGQSGPYAQRAGHDINYLAISGLLGMCGPDAPVAPPAFLGDLANGSYLAVIGIMLALFERERTGRGRVIDAAIVDGASYMLTAMFAERTMGAWSGVPDDHLLAGNAPFYGTYRCADGGWFAVGAIEPKFYDALLTILGFVDEPRDAVAQYDRTAWPRLRAQLADRFAERSRDAWTVAFAGVDACATPVLGLEELAADPHLADRGSVVADGRSALAAAAPRLAREPLQSATSTTARAGDTVEILRRYGLKDDEIAKLTSNAETIGRRWNAETPA